MSDLKLLLSRFYNWGKESEINSWTLVVKSFRGMQMAGRSLLPLYLVLFLVLVLYSYYTRFIAIDFNFSNIIYVFLEVFCSYMIFALIIKLSLMVITNSHQISLQLDKIFIVILSSLCVSVAVTLGAMLVLPGIYFLVSSCFYVLAIMLEDKGIFSSIQRSFLLIKNHWWIGLKTVGSPILMLILLMSFLLKMPLNSEVIIGLLALLFPLAIIFCIFVFINLYLSLVIKNGQ